MAKKTRDTGRRGAPNPTRPQPQKAGRPPRQSPQKAAPPKGAARNTGAPAPQETPLRAALAPVLAPGAPLIAVVGGGAAGLAAAIAAAGAAGPRARVLLLERQPRVGRKLLATGSGRCNLSNTTLGPANYTGDDTGALAAFLRGHAPQDTVAWLGSLGLLCRTEDGRLYPHCNQASMVLAVLLAAAARAGVQTVCDCAVQRITPAPAGFWLDLARPTGPDKTCLQAAKVVLATGGAAAPALGGSMAGYDLLPGLGHGCTPLAPGLVGLRWAAAGGQPGLKGIRAEAAVTLYDGDRAVAREQGEVQCTAEGLSGIPILQLSLLWPGLGRPQLALDLLPQLTAAQLAALLAERCALPGLTLEGLLLGTVAKPLGLALLKAAGLGPLSRPAADLTAAERAAVCALLQDWRPALAGTLGWQAAQVTLGGVPLAEVSPGDCASRLQPGLYLAGELLDAAGQCGGYNLDWAFTTGRRAGAAAALSLL